MAKIEPFQDSLFAQNFLKLHPENQSLQMFATEDAEEVMEEIQLKGKLTYVDKDLENGLIEDYQSFFSADYLGEEQSQI